MRTLKNKLKNLIATSSLYFQLNPLDLLLVILLLAMLFFGAFK